MNQQIREVVLSTVMQKQAEERSTARRSLLQKSAGAGSTLKLVSKTPVFREYLSKLIGGSVGGGVVGASIGTPIGVLSGLVNSTADEAKGSRTSTLLKNIAGGAGIGAAAGAAPFAIGATAVDAPKLLKVIKALRRLRG